MSVGTRLQSRLPLIGTSLSEVGGFPTASQKITLFIAYINIHIFISLLFAALTHKHFEC